MPQLIVMRDGRVENHVKLGQVTLTIGRDPSNHVPLPDASNWVSRFHAELRHGPAGHTLVDLGTPNGMLVDGARVKQVLLASGVRVILGPYTVEYLAGTTLESDPGDDGTVLDPQARGLRAGSAPTTGTPASRSTAPKPLPVPHWTKGEKQAFVFLVILLVVVGVGVVGSSSCVRRLEPSRTQTLTSDYSAPVFD